MIILMLVIIRERKNNESEFGAIVDLSSYYHSGLRTCENTPSFEEKPKSYYVIVEERQAFNST